MDNTRDKATWRDKGAVRLTAMVDMILSIFLFAFYFIGGFVMNTVVFEVRNGPFSKIALIIISLILWAMVFGITYLQLAAAYRLFLVTFQDALGPQVAVTRALSWLRTAAIVFGLVIFKMIYFLVKKTSPMGFVWAICIFEILFRLLGVYFIREFCDDLKHHIGLGLRRAPSVTVKHVIVNDVPTVMVNNNLLTV